MSLFVFFGIEGFSSCVIVRSPSLTTLFASVEVDSVLEEVDVLFPSGFLAGGSFTGVAASSGLVQYMGGFFDFVWGNWLSQNVDASEFLSGSSC